MKTKLKRVLNIYYNNLGAVISVTVKFHNYTSERKRLKFMKVST